MKSHVTERTNDVKKHINIVKNDINTHVTERTNDVKTHINTIPAYINGNTDDKVQSAKDHTTNAKKEILDKIMGTSTETLTERFNNVDSNIANVKNDTNNIVNNLGTIFGTTIADTLSGANTNISSIKASTDLIGTKDDATEATIFGKLNSISSSVTTIKNTTNDTKNKVLDIATKLYGTDTTTDTVFSKIDNLNTAIAGVESRLNTKLVEIKTIVDRIDTKGNVNTMNDAYKASVINEVSSYCSTPTGCANAIIGVLKRDGFLK